MYNEGKNLTKVGLRKKWAQGISDIEHGQFFKLFSAKRNQEFGQQPAEKWHQENIRRNIRMFDADKNDPTESKD